VEITPKFVRETKVFAMISKRRVFVPTKAAPRSAGLGFQGPSLRVWLADYKVAKSAQQRGARADDALVPAIAPPQQRS
jgi:hypothetical protein